MLKAVHPIRGVASVSKGKGKGTNKAHPGDLFEPVSKESGDKLLRDGSAVRTNEELPNTQPKYRGPDVIEGENDISKIAERIPGDDSGEDEAEEVTPAKQAKASKAKGKAAKVESQETDAGEDLNDIGLG
jgi:hypothetical protein